MQMESIGRPAARSRSVFRVVKNAAKGTDKRILGRRAYGVKSKDSRARYPGPMRKVRSPGGVQRARVELLTNSKIGTA
jgi:hypothetical protein